MAAAELAPESGPVPVAPASALRIVEADAPSRLAPSHVAARGDGGRGRAGGPDVSVDARAAGELTRYWHEHEAAIGLKAYDPTLLAARPDVTEKPCPACVACPACPAEEPARGSHRDTCQECRDGSERARRRSRCRECCGLGTLRPTVEITAEARSVVSTEQQMVGRIRVTREADTVRRALRRLPAHLQVALHLLYGEGPVNGAWVGIKALGPTAGRVATLLPAAEEARQRLAKRRGAEAALATYAEFERVHTENRARREWCFWVSVGKMQRYQRLRAWHERRAQPNHARIATLAGLIRRERMAQGGLLVLFANDRREATRRGVLEGADRTTPLAEAITARLGDKDAVRRQAFITDMRLQAKTLVETAHAAYAAARWGEAYARGDNGRLGL